MHLMNIQPETVIASALSAAIVGFFATYFAMWAASVRMDGRVKALESAITAFQVEVGELRNTINDLVVSVAKLSSVGDNFEDIFSRLRTVETDVAVLKSGNSRRRGA